VSSARVRRRGRLLGASAAAALITALAGATPALAAGTPRPWWNLQAIVAPRNLPPGGEGAVYISAVNVGDANVVASGSKVTLTDNLPAGLEAVPGGSKAVAGSLLSSGTIDAEPGDVPCEVQPQRVTCTFDGPKPLDPFVPIEALIYVKVGSGATSGEANEVTISGGGTPPVTLTQPLTVSSEATPFGIDNFALVAEEEGGGRDPQAGSHPFQLTTTVSLNQNLIDNPSKNVGKTVPKVPASSGLLKDVAVRLPPGLVGNAVTFPKCSEADFSAEKGFQDNCPANTAVGVASVTLLEPNVPAFDSAIGGVGTATVPVFNLVPARGEPARFGFDAFNILVTLDTSVATGEDYAVLTSVNNASQIASLISSQITLWGVPADPRHSQSRGWQCLGGSPNPFPSCASLGQSQPAPFLTLPRSCNEPLRSTLLADSWAEPGAHLPGGEPDPSDPRWRQARTGSTALGGCNLLPFTPSISLEPETQAGSTPTGLNVNVHVPQQPSESANGLAEADVKGTTVTLPQGMLTSPAAAHGLQACSETNIGFKGFQEYEPEVATAVFTPTLPEPFCPQASKVGTVRVKTPLLAHELEGAVYLAQQTANPFGSLLALYIVAEDPVSGVLVKLAGRVTLNQETGQIVSTFENTPQTPFEDFKVHFFGGPTAQLTTPAYCGTYTTIASFTPWSGSRAAPGAVQSSSSFPITSNCTTPPNPQPFTPSFQAGSTNNHAGAFTPFTLTIANPDGDQALRGLTMHLPSGLAAMISSTIPCPEPQAARNECGPDSLIGHSTAYAGLGGDPFPLPGRVYLTGPYKGGPFGVSVVTPAVAGPFNLGDVTVRSKIEVDPTTAAVTITSDPFPIFVQGIPAQLKQINVTIDRPGFQFNPTNCSPLEISGTMTGAQGASAPASSPFQAANCASLPFKPKLEASVVGQASKANGATFKVRVSSTPGQANIGKTNLTIPAVLPSRLTTIQKACLAATFAANPASCPEGSNIGSATVHTPVFKNPLVGPAYLVSYGAEKFPDVEFVLQGEGVKIVLDGHTDIKKGVTYSRFEVLPDAPVSTFETILPAGPHSALTANVPESRRFNLCGTKVVMPTVITGQNGSVIKQETKVAVTGCKATKKHTRAQLLAKALKACKKKKSKAKRSACARQARKKYGAKGSRRAPRPHNHAR
jgi:hypothetical protein